MLKDLVLKNRSTRRFQENQTIAVDILKELVDLARLSPSGANLQPLKYMISNTAEMNDKIFPSLAWAGYLTDWTGPGEGQRPAAYIVVLVDLQISKNAELTRWDQGIAAQSIMLGAAEKGLSGCMIGSINRAKLAEAIGIEQRYEIGLVLAMGRADEDVVLEEIDAYGSIKYYRDDNSVHHTPKRKLDDVIVGCMNGE